MSSAAVKKVIRDASVFEARKDNDTIRVWENYRDQAILWRSIALIQFPATAIALIFAMFMWNAREVILNVPSKPLPGIYKAEDIPDTEFVDAATGFTNLVASYQPNLARRQFAKAAEQVKEPLLSRFAIEMMQNELQTIENTQRTQIFFVDPTRTTVTRDGKDVKVTLTGERVKYIAGKEIPSIETSFIVTMTTVPRNVMNPYGIVVNDMAFENLRK
jgi:hypothetical protein